jgi:hypothetical protein
MVSGLPRIEKQSPSNKLLRPLIAKENDVADLATCVFCLLCHTFLSVSTSFLRRRQQLILRCDFCDFFHIHPLIQWRWTPLFFLVLLCTATVRVDPLLSRPLADKTHSLD